MKAIVALLLIPLGCFAITPFRSTANCIRYRVCPKGYWLVIDPANGQEKGCKCEYQVLPTKACQYSIRDCLRLENNAVPCANLFKECDTDDAFQLCDRDYFKSPDVCDKATAIIRQKEFDANPNKNMQLCYERKKTCLDTGGWACSVVPLHCDTDSILEVCNVDSHLYPSTDICIKARRAKRKEEEEKSKYTCEQSIYNCRKRPNNEKFHCPQVPEYCGVEALSNACLKGQFKSNDTLCIDTIKKLPYQDIDDIDELQCVQALNACNGGAGDLNSCSIVPAVCGSLVTSALCKNTTIASTRNYNLMCKYAASEVPYSSSECETFAHGCEHRGLRCPFVERFCDLKTIADFCKKNFPFDKDLCAKAVKAFPPEVKLPSFPPLPFLFPFSLPSFKLPPELWSYAVSTPTPPPSPQKPFPDLPPGGIFTF